MNTEPTPNLRISSTANALEDLFDLSKDNLSDDKLAWFAGLLTPAISEAFNASSALLVLATTHGSNLNRCDLPAPCELSNVLFGLADSIDNIRALMSIVEEAHYLANKRRATSKPG